MVADGRARAVLCMLIINVQNKFLKKGSKKREKQVNVFKIHSLQQFVQNLKNFR